VAFGIRNVQQPERACGEMARALRSGGRLAILEFGVPRIPGVRSLYLWYFRHLLPLVGRAVSGHSAAYSYLPASVGTFPAPAEFMATLRRAGFADVRADPLTFGIVYLYTGRKI
jgi:demethylmenaquinone methyltransferase/2-methoxy-6-polyprenyl-1,4-benzoquinol methylase